MDDVMITTVKAMAYVMTTAKDVSAAINKFADECLKGNITVYNVGGEPYVITHQVKKVMGIT